MTARSTTFKAHIALAAANILYGINYSVAKIALHYYIDPFGFVLLRVVVAVLLFWLLHAFFVREKIARKDIPLMMLCGLTGVSINQLLFFKGLNITTEINASLIMITTPVLVLMISHFLLKERITIKKALGVLCGGAGAFLLIGFGKDFSFGSATVLGDFFIFLNAISYALYLVLVKPLMRKYHPLTVITYVFLFGFPLVGVLGWQELDAVQWETFTWQAWASVGFVVIGTTFLAYLLNIFALAKVNPSVVSVYIYAQPLIAGIIAISIGNDALTLLKLLAAVLIFLGVYLVSNFKPKRKIGQSV